MRRAMKEFHLPEPKFENRRDEFVVTFYNAAPDAPAVPDIPAENIPRTDLLLEFCKTVSFAMRKYITPLVQSGRLEMTLPEKPKSKNQRYRTRPQQAL